MSAQADALIVEDTRDWVARAVVGLGLCPYAKAPHIKGQIRYVVCNAKTGAALRQALSEQLLYLQATPPEICETTLLIHPHVLQDFLDYNDFLADADELLDRLDLTGVFQIASFHPDYQFADEDAKSISNYTNRSPHPMLHILREASVDAALRGADDPQTVADAIVSRNQETLAKLGHEGWKKLWT